MPPIITCVTKARSSWSFSAAPFAVIRYKRDTVDGGMPLGSTVAGAVGDAVLIDSLGFVICKQPKNKKKHRL